MKKLTRILTLILATVLLVGCFSSCKFNLFGKDEESEEISTEESTVDTGDATETDAQTDTESEASEESDEDTSEEESSEEAEERFVLTKELLSNYSIVTPLQSNEDMNAVAKVLQRSIKDATGLELEIRSDLIIEGNDMFSESEYEILVGETNREVGKEYYKDVKINDYGYAMVGKKILILGYTNSSANNAVIEFKLDVLKGAANKDELMDSEYSRLVRGKYDKDTILIN